MPVITNRSMKKSKCKSKNTFRQWKNGHTTVQNLGEAAKAFIRGKYIVI